MKHRIKDPFAVSTSANAFSNQLHYFRQIPAAFLAGLLWMQTPALAAEQAQLAVAPAMEKTMAGDYINRTDFFLDTVIDIKIYDTDDTALLDDCFRLISDYENALSRTIEGSEIWKINHSQGEPQIVSRDTAYLLDTALTYCELSGGLFDISIAPVVDLWDFHEDSSHSLPDADALDQALSHVDYRKVVVTGVKEPYYDSDGKQTYLVTLEDPDAQIDLGGIAKGFIADKVKEYLISRNITSALINLGGNVLALGSKPDGSPYNIGIRRPFGAGDMDLITVVSDNDLSIVTSGNYERYFELDGTLYHHILDPATGYPADTGVQSVTILCSSSAEGDALSTTCFLLGLDKGLELIESMDGYEALFINEKQELIPSSGFPLRE